VISFLALLMRRNDFRPSYLVACKPVVVRSWEGWYAQHDTNDTKRRKPMIKLSHLMLLLTLYGFSELAVATQSCQSESEVPASTPTSQFIDHGDGSMTDSKTGLMWAKCSEGLSGSDCATGGATTPTWQVALDLANASFLAGYSDWRLPNVNELHSIVEVQCYDPSINLSVFPNTPVSNYWSSSPYAADLNASWEVIFSRGDSYSHLRNTGGHVRLVRGGE
jgi:hypothetical protein